MSIFGRDKTTESAEQLTRSYQQPPGEHKIPTFIGQQVLPETVQRIQERAGDLSSYAKKAVINSMQQSYADRLNWPKSASEEGFDEAATDFAGKCFDEVIATIDAYKNTTATAVKLTVYYTKEEPVQGESAENLRDEEPVIWRAFEMVEAALKSDELKYEEVRISKGPLQHTLEDLESMKYKESMKSGATRIIPNCYMELDVPLPLSHNRH